MKHNFLCFRCVTLLSGNTFNNNSIYLVYLYVIHFKHLFAYLNVKDGYELGNCYKEGIRKC